MNLVEQETDKGCGVACLAMVLGVDYWKAQEIIGHDPNEYLEKMEHGFLGVTAYHFDRVLFEQGFSSMYWFAPDVMPEESWANGYWDRLGYQDHKWLRDIWHGDETMAIIAGVPSINVEGQGHWIVLHAGRVLDPSKLNKQTDVCTRDIGEATIIKLRGR